MIAFETPVPTTNVLPSPAVSVSSSPSVPASTNAVPPLKDASIYTKPAFSDVIHSIPSHKCPICKEMYVKTDIEAHVDICLEKSNSVSSSIFASFVQRKHFCSKDKKVFNVRRSNLVKDVLAKCKLFFRDGIKPIHVKFVEDPNTIDAGGKKNQYVFRQDAHLVDNSDFKNLGELIAVGFLLGLPGPRNWSVPLSWYILGSQTPCTISDVPIHAVMVKLESINNAESQKMLDVTLEDVDERFEAGYNKMDIQLDNKNDIIKKVTRYFVITRQLEEINQFSKGLKELNVLQNLKLFKDETIKEFIVSSANKLTSKMLQEIFKEVKYSECEAKNRARYHI